ncbi:MAG TPA: hypothetical protein VJA21_01155, partial [Verrucomicrobiae bacterium]
EALWMENNDISYKKLAQLTGASYAYCQQIVGICTLRKIGQEQQPDAFLVDTLRKVTLARLAVFRARVAENKDPMEAADFARFLQSARVDTLCGREVTTACRDLIWECGERFRKGTCAPSPDVQSLAEKFERLENKLESVLALKN